MRLMSRFITGLLGLAALLVAAALPADELEVGGGEFIGLTSDKPFLHVIHQGRSVKVQRVQDPDYELKGYFARTARKCPPFCLKPMEAAPGVKTVGEVEVFDFMENQLRDGKGLLVDARTTAWYEKGTIPGSINLPFTLFTKDPDDEELVAVLKDLGGKPRDTGFFARLLEEWGISDGRFKTDKWDFTDAKELMLWCNGPACGQSPRAIQGLRAAGYPAEKMYYYRGGMQMWQLFGLTTVKPE